MNIQYEIIKLEKTPPQFYVVPKKVSGRAWPAETKKQAEEILQFVKKGNFEGIKNIRRKTL